MDLTPEIIAGVTFEVVDNDVVVVVVISGVGSNSLVVSAFPSVNADDNVVVDVGDSVVAPIIRVVISTSDVNFTLFCDVLCSSLGLNVLLESIT